MHRIYEGLIKEHFANNQQMLFLAGPRQVGKTTISLAAKALTDEFTYLNWDNYDDRRLIVEGPSNIAVKLGLSQLRKKLPIVVFDEIHKYTKWKIFLKGFFDTYKNQVKIIVTGSSKLNIYRRGGDSLMGRYFCYRIHPISVAECLHVVPIEQEINKPTVIDKAQFQALWEFGGFPEPFLKHETRFYQRWKNLRQHQLFREDIRDLSHIQEIAHIEILANILKEQAGQLVNLSSFAKHIQVSVSTIKRWLGTLENFYYCFLIKPWTKNISRSLLKEPKLYLWDWSEITDPGAKAENFVAAHLLKAIHYWTDCGFGNYDLFFIRDKDKREVDFLVTKNQKPWFLVEVKHSKSNSLNENLYRFQEYTKAQHAFQVVFDLEPIEVDCFTKREPIIVPVQTFLSQLV